MNDDQLRGKAKKGFLSALGVQAAILWRQAVLREWCDALQACGLGIEQELVVKLLGRIAAIAVGLVLAGHVAAGGLDIGFDSRAPVVGELGDLSRAVFTGNRTFSGDTLRWGLRADLDCVVAIQPGVGLDECFRTLESSARAGYQHAGFPDAAVRAETDVAAHRIVFRITEGPRFLCGQALVRGLKTLDRETVQAQIMARIAPGNLTNRPTSLLKPVGLTNDLPTDQLLLHPLPEAVILVTNRAQVAEVPLGIWGADLPAPMDAGARRSLAEAVTNVFADLGHFHATFGLNFVRRVESPSNSVPNSGASLLDLVVEVQDEGPPCTIGEIEVSQIHHHSRDELLRWLDLAPGQRLTRELLLEKQNQLVESGRFTEARLEPGTPDSDGKVRLRIAVHELALAPPLSATLSPDESALQRLRHWLSDWPACGEDAVLRLDLRTSNETLRVVSSIASPSGGLLIRLNRSQTDSPDWDWALAASSNTVALFDGARREGLCTTNWHGSLNLFLHLGADPDGAGNMAFGGGFNSETSAQPFRVDLRLLPVAFMRLARLHDVQWHSDRGLLIGSSTNMLLRADPLTGRLIELRLNRDAEDLPLNLSRAQLVLEFRTNALAQAFSKTLADAAGFTNRFDQQHPRSSVLAFLVTEAFRSSFLRKIISTNVSAESIVAATSTLGKLVDPDLFAAWEHCFGPTNAPGADSVFLIPPDSSGSNPLDFVAAWILGNSGELVAPDSWVAAVLCEKALSVSRRANEVGRAWERLFSSPESGPLACLAGAWDVNPQVARAFAIKGLVQLSREDFERDCQALIQGDGAVPATIRHLLTKLASLDHAEIESLARLLPPSEGEALLDAVQVLRQPGTTPSAASLHPVLGRWWDASLRGRLSAAFRKQMTTRASSRSPQ